jgi:translation initiation factor 2 gamma subunit (eIF-2gamma)
MRHKAGMVRNSTVKLGYVQGNVYRCNNPSYPGPGCDTSCGSERRHQKQLANRLVKQVLGLRGTLLPGFTASTMSFQMLTHVRVQDGRRRIVNLQRQEDHGQRW